LRARALQLGQDDGRDEEQDEDSENGDANGIHEQLASEWWFSAGALSGRADYKPGGLLLQFFGRLSGRDVYGIIMAMINLQDEGGEYSA
jgi:hypothetical protein